MAGNANKRLDTGNGQETGNDMDVLADDVEFTFDVGKIVQGASGETAVECKKEADYTLFAKSFACNICTGVYPGDAKMAQEHVIECAQAPTKAHEKKTAFCFVCWKMISTDQIKIHLSGADHNRVLAYREKNNAHDIGYWITNNGATQVKPLNPLPENSIKFRIYPWAMRLMNTKESLGSKDATRQERILNQIKTAVQSGSGNRGAVSAKLGENSALVCALDALTACVTIGFMPCHVHGDVTGDHSVYDMHEAVQLFFKATAEKSTLISPSAVRCKGSIKQSDGKYKQCSETLKMFDEPRQLYLLLKKMRETIIGQAAKE